MDRVRQGEGREEERELSGCFLSFCAPFVRQIGVKGSRRRQKGRNTPLEYQEW